MIDIHSHFNLVEGIFWIVLAFIVWVWSFKVESIFQKFHIVAGILLVAFGCSDFMEIRTGAWWKPWWLLVWKGVCLTGIVILLVWYYLLKRRDTKAKE
ncbi:MAG: hypothetical protein ACYSUK_06540 [Planctomycetota bacterium]|jgi:hypothetical protein